MKFNRKQVREKILRSWLEILAKELKLSFIVLRNIREGLSKRSWYYTWPEVGALNHRQRSYAW